MTKHEVLKIKTPNSNMITVLIDIQSKHYCLYKMVFQGNQLARCFNREITEVSFIFVSLFSF